MSNGKGKGRAYAVEDAANLNVDEELEGSASMLQKVVDSATGLARSTFAYPTSGELKDATLNALSSSGKGQSSRGNDGSAWAHSSGEQRVTGPFTSNPPGIRSLKETHANEHALNAEAEFSNFLDGVDMFTPSSAADGEANDPRFALKSLDTVEPESPYREGIPTHPPAYTSIQEQEHHDGEEVLAILSNPHATDDIFETRPIEDETVEWNLTEEQKSSIRSLMDEYFPLSESHTTPGVHHPLNLIPGMVVSGSDDHGQQLTNSRLYFGEDLPSGEAQNMWINQWEGVLTRYTDEVWGDLLPLVQEARQEVEAIKADPEIFPDNRPKALRRLGLVLGHLRGA